MENINPEIPSKLYIELAMLFQKMYKLATVGQVNPKITPTAILAGQKSRVWIGFELDANGTPLIHERFFDFVLEVMRNRDYLDMSVTTFGSQASHFERHHYGTVFSIEGMQSRFVPFANGLLVHNATLAMDESVLLCLLHDGQSKIRWD